MTFSVFYPKFLITDNSDFPVVYWLSGLTCTDENFVQKAGIQRYASELGVIIVAPDTSPRGENIPDDENGAYDFGLGAGFYLNATREPGKQNFECMITLWMNSHLSFKRSLKLVVIVNP